MVRVQHSIDPAGVDPSGMDVIHGADPPRHDYHDHDGGDSEEFPPIRSPPTSPAGPPPPTPRRAGQQQHQQAPNSSSKYGVRQPSPVMAFLVGDPPPPPPTPPPQKTRHRHSNSQGGPISPPGDNTSTATGFSSGQHKRAGSRDPLEMNHRVVVVASSSHDSGNHNLSHNTEKETVQEVPKATTSVVSPRSAATEPHSNKQELHTDMQESGDGSVTDVSTSSSKGSNTSKSTKTDGVSTSSPQPPSNKKRLGRIGRGRDKSVERKKRGESQERKGFFRKMFRGNKQAKKTAVEQANAMMESASPPPPPPPPPKESASKTKSNQVTFRKDEKITSDASRLAVDTTKQQKTTFTSPDDNSPTDDYFEGLDTVTSRITYDKHMFMMDPDEDRREIFFAHDDVSTLTAPSAVHSYAHSRHSIDPVDTTTVATGASSSEPVGRYWKETSGAAAAESLPKRNQREASPVASSLTTPLDSLNKQTFQDPDGESPITSKKVNDAATFNNKNSLVVDVAHAQEDPAGETPPANAASSGTHGNEPSPRGWESPVTKFKDPMGSTVSESNSLQPMGGFGRESSSTKLAHNKLPPGETRSLPHELRREPSALRDGSPYILDPPLRTHRDGDMESKSLVHILSKKSTKDMDNVKSRVEPPTPTLHDGAADFHQPPTPSERLGRSENAGGAFEPSPIGRAERTTPSLEILTKKSERATNPPVVNVALLESPDATGFLDDLFDEKPSRKRSSILPPSDGEGSLNSPSKNQQVAAHPTQSPITLSLSQKSEQSRFYGEEEKKDQDDIPDFSVSDDPKASIMLATSTAALSTAACMNAKTVAYLHTLNGEPSPRHSWRRPDMGEYSPAKDEPQKKAITTMKIAMSKNRAVTLCRTDEAAFDSFISSGPVNTTRAAQITTKSTKTTHFRTKYGALSPRSRKAARDNFKRPVHWFRFNRDVRVSGVPLSFGLDLQRKKREEDILSGRVNPVRIAKKSGHRRKPSASPFKSLREEDIKDPIQRAGVRLLSKAAIPIQTCARQYLARQEASNRMQATLVLQSFFRQWQSEAFLRAYKHACTKVQAAFRSWSVREAVAFEHYNATQIQKVVRGYIAMAYVYDTLYWVARVQATMRGKLARLRLTRQKQLRQRSAQKLQAWNRGCLARKEAGLIRAAACCIQAQYKAHVGQIAYKHTVSNIVLTQSVARQFLANKEMQKRRSAEIDKAARRIQATWRGFQGYTDYIFALVDILVLQRSMRKCLAVKKVNSIRRNQAAVKIQAQWRRQKALIGMLYDLVHIIIAQSVIRRFLAKKMLPQKRLEYSERMSEQQKLDSAATKIQTSWRGFLGYSQFIIMQYEIVRLQAIVRGRASRNIYSLKLGCCIMIQSAVRRHLASEKTLQMKIDQAALNSEVESMRTALACRRVQFWWRVVLECSREKKAALVIERFFLMVKTEVDKEIRRQSQIKPKAKHRSKQNRHQTPSSRRATDSDENLLEHVWKNTVNETHVPVINCASPSRETRGARNSRSSSNPRLHQNPSYISAPSRDESPMHRPSSPSNNLVFRHEYDEKEKSRELELRARKEEALKASRRIQRSKQPQPMQPLPQDVMLARSDERTELSAITSPTVFKVDKKSSKKKKKLSKSSKKYDDDMSVESLLGEEIVDHLQQSGRQSAPNNWSKKHHFFDSEDAGVVKQHDKSKRHSTSSLASGSDSSHMYSRNATATTVTRTTVDSMSQSDRSDCETYADMRTSDKYNNSAASKGRKLLESVRKGSTSSPRHGRIVIKNACIDYPMLSADDENVEVELLGDQFGMI